jgi:peptide/nickel transport system ATP-binding protein
VSFSGVTHAADKPVPAGAAPACSAFSGSSRALLTVRDLRVGFAREGGRTGLGMAVDGVSFSLARGKTLCLVGESGCGKSVAALSLLGLLPSPPAKIAGGSVLFDGRDLTTLPEKELRDIRGSRVGMVFQDPMTSLNPVMRIGEQMTEGLRRHRGLSSREAAAVAVKMLDKVGIADAGARARDFPHQMSGGMRQRVMIGMALACDPDLIIADEPTTALDVTVQKQILGLMRSLMDDSGSGLLLITHDLGIVSRIADDVAVMYAGRIVEQGPARVVLDQPAHPYTVGLLRSRPGVGAKKRRLQAIAGTVPGLWSRPQGCAFHPRCEHAFDRCRSDAPPSFPLRSGGVDRQCRCWLRA